MARTKRLTGHWSWHCQKQWESEKPKHANPLDVNKWLRCSNNHTWQLRDGARCPRCGRVGRWYTPRRGRNPAAWFGNPRYVVNEYKGKGYVGGKWLRHLGTVTAGSALAAYSPAYKKFGKPKAGAEYQIYRDNPRRKKARHAKRGSYAAFIRAQWKAHKAQFKRLGFAKANKRLALAWRKRK